LKKEEDKPMFLFTKKQEVFDISGIKIGGQPGEYPTVLFGGVFFKGEPDFEKEKKNIQNMLDLSRKTDNPAIPDFFIKKEEYVEKIVDFIERALPKNYPFSIDIIDPAVKIKTLEYLDKRHLLPRTIYNSIHVGITDKERKSLKKHRPEMTIIVAFNPKDKSPDGKIEVLENGAHLTDKGLLALAEEIGIKKILIDTAALAPGENSGASIAAIPVIKEEYGLPTGCAIHNVVEKSNWLKNFESARKTVDTSSNVNIALFGGNYAIYGPLENADLVFPTIAWQDILVSEYMENYFGIKPSDNHPRRKLF
jgi:tetrahydromethanopterin S-methyltransferase subunit H